jgi:hypothetical protein
MSARTVKKQKTDSEYGVAANLDSLPKLTVSQEWLVEARTEVFGTNDEMRLIPATRFVDSDWSRLFEQYYRERIVYVRSNETLLLRFAYDYEVDLNRIESEADLLRWTLHLCEKTWMTTERLHFFIEAVAQIKKFNLHRPLARARTK